MMTLYVQLRTLKQTLDSCRPETHETHETHVSSCDTVEPIIEIETIRARNKRYKLWFAYD